MLAEKETHLKEVSVKTMTICKCSFLCWPFFLKKKIIIKTIAESPITLSTILIYFL